MASFNKKSVTFSSDTKFAYYNSPVPRINPPLPRLFKQQLWYSQRELAYLQFEIYRQKKDAKSDDKDTIQIVSQTVLHAAAIADGAIKKVMNMLYNSRNAVNNSIEMNKMLIKCE
jgi:hypothetical protein